MAQHVKILGILHIIHGSLIALGGLIAFMVMGGLATLVGASDHSADAAAGVTVLGGIGLFVFVLLLILGLPGIIGGWFLMQFRPWARILVIVLSALDLFSIPFGTALGIYGFWVLLNQQTEQLFQNPAMVVRA